MSTSSDDLRRRELAAIHVARAQLGLEEDEYRDLLEEWTGKRSAAKLSQAQRRRVIELFRDLGFERAPGRAHPNRDEDSPQVAMAKNLWLSLHRLGAVRNPSEQALNAWIRRQTGIAHINWLDGKRLNSIIEALKQWLARASEDGPPPAA